MDSAWTNSGKLAGAARSPPGDVDNSADHVDSKGVYPHPLPAADRPIRACGERYPQFHSLYYDGRRNDLYLIVKYKQPLGRVGSFEMEHSPTRPPNPILLSYISQLYFGGGIC